MVAPDFTERLQNVATRQGEPVELSVTVNGNDAVVAWFREGAAIQNGGDFVISSSGNRHTLSITSPYPEDSGVFTVTASNASGKATSTASLFVEAASSDEEYAVHQSTQKSVQKTTVTESSTSVKAVKKSASASSKKIAGFQPSAQQNMFAKVFMSAETGLKKVKKVKKTKVESSAETEYETVAESCTEAECFTETEASSVEQIGSMTKISPQVPRKPTALDLIKKPQIEVSSPLGKKREIQGFRSVKSTTGKIHQISSSKKVDINIDRTSNQQILYGAKFNPGGGVVRHVTAPSGPRSREASEERRTNYATSNYESEFEQVDIDDEEEAGNEELVEVDSLPATPEPEDNAPVEDEPQEPFAPRFEMPPEDVDVIEGDVAILQAHIAAWPEPEIKWYREGALIDNCEDYQVSFEDGIAQLVIRNCYPDDAGKFTISASNQMGTSSSTCLLGVKSTSQCERDQFEQVYEESANESANESGTATSDPDDESVIVKRTDVLSPVHEGAEGLQSPASPVRHHQSPEQVLEEAMEIVTQAEQRLAATSPVAASPVPAALPPASGAPRFSTIPDRCVLLQEGATQVFEAVAPGAHVFWERDGKPIIGGYRVKVEEDEKKCKSTLTLNMVFPEDAGEYVAVAANQFGKSTHSVFFLSSEHYAAFMRKGGEVPTGLTDYTTAESSDELDSRGRRENLKNIKKGVGIKSGGTPLGTRSPSPRLRSMSGSPKRAASPGQGRLSTLDPADMSKVYKPVFLVKAVNQEITEGKATRINIRVTGRPPAQITWLKNGEPVQEDDTHRIIIKENGVESLIFDSVTEADSGEYTVVAANVGGKAVSNAKITVLPSEEAQRPQILEKPVSTKVNAGESVRLAVFAVGRPTPDICWLKDNQLLIPEKHTNYQFEGVDGHGLLTIDAATKAHDGWYTATAINRAGRDLCRCKITVSADEKKQDAATGRKFQSSRKGLKKKADASPGRHTGKLTQAPEDFDEADLFDKSKKQKPVFKKKISNIKTKTLGEATFECRVTPIGDPTMKVQWLLEGKPLENANRIQTMFEFGYTSLTVTHCYPRDTGVITCRVTNAHGAAESSATLIVKEDRGTTFAAAEGRAMQLIAEREKNFRADSESPPYARSPTKGDDDAQFAPQIVSIPDDCKTNEGQPMRFKVRCTGNPQPKVEWYLNGQQIRKSKRFTLWNDGLHHLEINPARAYDTGSLVAVAINKIGQAQASCCVDVEPLGDLRSNLKRVDSSSPDSALRAMRIDRKVDTEKRTAELEEVQLRRTSMNSSPTKSRPSAAYDPELREKFHKVKTEEHQMTAARVTVQKKPDHFDQKDQEELLKKTKRELEHWETPEETPSPMGQPDLPSHALQVEIPDFSDIKAKDTENDLFQPPVITEKLKDIKFDSDTDATIRVRFFGSPMPELQWFHNGVELSMDTRRYWKFVDNSTCELYIFKVNAQDEGQYAARVSNRGGEELSTCIVTVNEIKRKILEGPRSQEWSSDMTARFEIVVSHKDVEGIWMKDGVEIAVSDKHFVEDIGGGRRRLTIQNLKKVDEGIYEYVYAGDRAAATLTVNQAKLEISEQLRDQSVLAGEVVTFDCLLTDETSDGKWFKDGEEIQVSDRLLAIAENQRQMLIIEDATEEDIGVYSFVVDGAQTSASLAIQDAVRIVQGLQPSEAVEGEQAVLAVVIEPESYTNGKWMKNGAELQFDSRMSYAQPQGGFKELVIRNVNSNDAGVYAFVAGNQVTECEFGIVEINVLEPLRDQQVELSGEVLFETLLSHVNVVGTWCKNDVPIKMEDERVQVFIDEKVQALYLNNVVPEDAGVYSFSAGGKSTACELLVAVPTPNVEFKHGLQDVQVKNKENVVFQIELTADVPGAWFKDGQPIADSDRVKSITEGVVRSLIIAEAGPEDEGVYTYACQNIQSSANLFVEVAYIIPKNFKDTSVAEGETAVFECEVTKSDLETHWFRDGVEIDVSDDKYEIIVQGLSYKLLIHNCTVRDKCEIVFLAADESVAANLQVNAAEIMEDAVDCVQNEGEDATFSVTTTSNATVFWTRDNVRIKPNAKYQSRMEGKKSFLTIKNVCVEDAGSYTCHVGSTESTAVLFVEVAEVKFVSSTNIEVAASLDKNYAEIEFQVNKEGAEGNWFHNGIQVNIEEAKYNYVVDRTYHKLIVKELDINDSGEYSFKTGTQVATAFLNVQAKEEPASFVRELSDAGADLSEDAEFYVEVAGVPTPVVTFYKQGTQIMPSGKHEIIQEGNVVKLIVNCCTEADVSQYSATAKNSTGTVMCKANLNIVEKKSWEQEEEQVQETAPEQQMDAPIITRKFENTSCKAGERVVLEVEYIGNNVDVAWYRNGTALDASSGRAEVVNDIGYTALIISSADHLGSSGNYSVTLQNAAGSASNAADLTVEGSPPEVVERPEGGNYKIGSEVKLAGKVVGQPTPQVHWEFNSEEIIDTRFKMYQDAGYCCLEFESATAKDSGKYTMVAENELGEARWTVTINVSVDDRPTSASSQRSVDVITHQRLSQDGHVVVTNEEVEVDPSTRPATKKISPPIASPPASAKRETPPEKKKAAPKQLPKQEEKPEEMPKLKPIKTKPVEAAPPAEKIQLKPAGKGVKDQEEPLKFPELKKRASPTSPTSPDFIKFDKVEEEKKARKSTKKPLKLNIPGKEKRTSVNAARLSKPVELLTPLPDAGKPLFVIAPEDAEFTIGEAAEVKCRIAGDPKPEIQWYKGKWGKLSAVGRISIDFNVESGISTLNIKKIQKPDKGTYRCVAKNDKGEAEASFTLNVVEKAQVRESVDRFALKPKKPVVKDDMNEFDTVKMLRDVDPKEYEKYANHFGVKDFRHLLTTYEEVAANVESEEIDEVENLPTPESAISLVPEEEIWQKCIEAVGKEPVDILQDIRDVIAVAQGDAIFEAEIRINVPNVDVKWFKEDTQLEEGEKYHMSHDGESHSLVIKNVTEEDKGEYRIEAGPAKSTANLEVKVPSPEPIIEIKKEKPVERAPPPRFDSPLRDLVKNRRDRVEFECSVSDPDAPVVWFKGDRELRPAAEYDFESKGRARKLVIKNATFDDAGRYSCEMGEEKTSASLKVNELELKVIKSLANVECPLDGDAIFDTVLNSKNAEPLWKKDGAPLRESDDVEMLEEQVEGGIRYRLILRKQTVDDSGEITFSALGNQAKQKASLNVKDLPLGFTLNMDDQIVKPGETARFETNVTRRDAVARWTAGGKPVQNSAKFRVTSRGFTRKLTIEDCDGVKDNYEVVCTVEEAGETASTKANLKTTAPGFAKGIEAETHAEENDKCVFIDCEVGVPTTEVSWYYRGPAFANELSDAEFPINQTAELCCDVNFPELVVVWDKDGQEIQDGGKYKMGTDGYRRTLAIADADESDSGVYTATLKDGTKSSANVKVVAAPAMTYTPPPVYRGTVEGYELDNSWKKLSDTDRLSVKANGTNRKIEIRDVKASDAGEYCCATPDAKTFGRICVEAFKFVRALEDTEVGEKESAEFFVELSKPSRKVTWTLNGNKITSGGDSVLRNEGKILTCIMDNVSMDMAGTIAVEVEHIRCEAQLAVTKDIKFTSKLEDKFATEKEDVVYEISVSSVDAEVTWSADGEPIAQVDGKYTIQKDGRKRRLTVHNLTKNDAKKYAAHLNDLSAGSALTVEDAPVSFTSNMMDAGAAEGKVATFECTLSRDVPVKWYKNKDEIKAGPKYEMAADGLKRTLTISDVGYNDESNYSCKAEDAKTTAALTVQTVAVEFVKSLSDLEVTEGDEIVFNVELNLPDIKPTQWFQNGMELTPKSPRVTMESEGANFTLKIANSNIMDNSEVMFNAAGVRSLAKVKVNQAALRFTKALEDKEAENKMASVELECELSRANANVQWFVNGAEIFPSRKFGMGIDGAKRSLVIHDISYDDAAEYTCDAGEVKSSAKLNVIPANIKFVTPLADSECFERESFSFEAEITHVNMEGKWFFNGEEIAASKKIEMSVQGTAHILTINDATQEDAGDYKFVVEGVETAAKLAVKEIPAKFVKRLQDEASTEKEECVLSCEVNRPNAEVVWKLNGEPVSAGDRYDFVSDGRRRALVIKSVVQEDEGKWTCDAGDDETTCELVVGGRDIRITKKMMDLEVIEGEKASFELQISHEDVETQWLINGEEQTIGDNIDIQVEGRRHVIVIDKADLKMSGSIVFQTDGAKQEARFDVVEAPCVFKAPINDITVLENENGVFECTVSKGGAEVTWFKGRTKLHLSDKYEMVAKDLVRSLIVKNASFDDEAQFSCQVGDSKCAAKLSITTMQVNILEPFGDETKTVGEPLELVVKASEIDQEARWMINGIQVRADDNVEFFVDGPNYGMRIKAVSLEMSGDISVSILNAKHTAALSVKESAAKFTTPLNDIAVENATKSVTFEAELNRANVNVKWYKNGEEIAASRKFDMIKRQTSVKLIISDVNYDDAGVYVCDCGDDQTESALEVTDQNITVVGAGIQDTVVIERDTAEFEIEISHSDIPAVWILKKGDEEEELVASKSVELGAFRTVHSLKLYNCELSQSGELIFKAGNLVTSCKFDVKEPGARFTKRLADQSATEADSAVFECEISRPNADVKWFHKDVEVEAGDKYQIEVSNRRRTLIVSNCSSADEGDVKCVSEDDETIAQLQIEGRDIKILKKLSDMEVTEGESASFELDVNYENVTGSWEVNGIAVEDGDVFETSVRGKKHILKVKFAATEHTGMVVWTSGRVKGTANLAVLEAPPSFVQQLEDKVCEEKSKATFSCRLSRSVKTRWLKDRRIPIQASDKYEIVDTDGQRTLIINDLTYDDEGTYTCDAESTKTTMTLTVCARDIKLKAQMSDSTAAEGSVGEMSFELTHTEVAVTWFRNGQKLAKSRTIEMVSEPTEDGCIYKLLVKEIGQDDGGVISFNAEGIQGEASLSVCATPVDVLEELPKTVVKEGDEASISVTVSDPRATGQWFINGVKLNRTDRIRLANDDGKHTLTIKNATRDEAGEVVFVCNNAKSTNEIIVKEPPVTFTRSMIDQSVTEASIVEFEIEINRLNGKVEWVDGQGAVISNEGRFEIVSEGRRRKLIIDNVRLSDAGEITVRGVKDEEDDEVNSAVAKLEVAARDVRIRRHLQDQQCYEGEQTDFTCDTSFADVSPHWTINGQLLQESEDVVFEQSGTRQRLVLKNVQLTQAGKVEFYGKTAASLTVLESPVDFTEEMDNIEVEEKTQAEFKCTLSRATAQVKWFKGRRLLKPGKKYEMIEDGPHRILRIPKVEFADEKDYSCTCDDAIVTAKLKVQPRNILMVSNLKDVSVSEGETAVFECELSHEEVDAIWYRDGSRIIKSAQVQMETDGKIARLTIKNTSEDEDNKSEIQCRAEDALSSAMLMVKGLDLTIVEPLNDKYAFSMGAQAAFSVKVSQPNAKGEWYLNGNQIRKSADIDIPLAKGEIHKITFAKAHKGIVGTLKFRLSRTGEECQAHVKVSGDPCKLVQSLPKEITGDLDMPLVFEVKLDRKPDPESSGWRKDGVPLERWDPHYKFQELDDGKHQKLIIPVASAEDVGHYSFDTGDEESTCAVTIKALEIEFVEGLVDEMILENDSATLSCKLNSDAKLREAPVVWYHDGKQIGTDQIDQYKITADGRSHSLTIRQAKYSDTGMWMAKTGDKHTEAKVTVKELTPVFESGLSDRTVRLGAEETTLSVVVSSPRAKVIWKKDDDEITAGDKFFMDQDEKNRSLTIKNAEMGDSGKYTCQLVGGSDTFGKVTVQDSPFDTEPQDKTVFIGDEVAFEVRTKESSAACGWSVNDETQDDQFFTPPASGFDRKLVIKSAAAKHTGKVKCHVVGYEDRPVECALKVIEHLKIQKELTKWSGKEGQKVTFEVDANKAADATWYVNRKEISDSRYEVTADEGKFALSFVASVDDDEAKIEVTLAGELKEFQTSSTTMSVESKGTAPKIGASEDAYILCGQADKFTFEVKGKPVADITVVHADTGKEMTVDRDAEVKVNRIINFATVERSDAGAYTITAKNENGDDSAVINVFVVDKPSAPVNLTVTRMTNNSCGFCWNAPADNGGAAIIKYHVEYKTESEDWTRSTVAVEETAFVARKLTKGEHIEIRVAAENKAGMGEFCDIVGPNEITDGVFPPGFPTGIKIDQGGVRANKVPLSWEAPTTDGGAPITGYIVEKCIDGADSFEPCGESASTSFDVTQVSEGKMYRFRVKAQNSAGVSGPSEPSAQVRAEDPNNKPDAPTGVTAQNPTNSSIDVSWTAPSGNPVDQYIIEALQHGTDAWVKAGICPAGESATTIEDLVADTKYLFRVFGQNKEGLSMPSEVSNPCVTLAGEAPDIEPNLVAEESVFKVVKGQPLQAKIKVVGRPKCEVEWTKNGEPWFEHARYGGGFANISVPAAVEGDSGDYEIVARNRAGEKRLALKVSVLDAPGLCTDLNVKVGNTLEFTWTKPLESGGDPIKEYIVQHKQAESSIWQESGRPSGEAFPFSDLPLNNSYEFRVAAVNGAGEGEFAEYEKPVFYGGVVSNLRVVKTTNDSVTLAWEPPASAPVTASGGYMVEMLKEEEIYYQVFSPGKPSKKPECLVTPLEYMSKWRFRVKCISEAGPGEPCEPTEWVAVEMDKVPPSIELWEGAENGLDVKVTQNRMVMPAKIQGKPQPEISWVKDGFPLSVDSRVGIKDTEKSSTFTMNDLNRSDSGIYIITAENDNGKAEKRISVNVMDRPGIPENFDITDITKKSCKLIWEAPKDAGGTPIRNYLVEKREVGRQVWGKMSADVKPDATSYVAERLVEGREYEFRVSARNDIGMGDGALSAPIVACYLFEVPEQMDPPQVLDTSISKNGMAIKWAEPEWDGGSPITGYWVEMSSPNSNRWSRINKKAIESGKRMFKVTNLKEGRDYIFRVCAENLAGLGIWSEPSEPEVAKDPESVPGRPGRPEVLAVGESTATLKWGAPKTGKVEHYVLEMRKRPQIDNAEKEAAKEAAKAAAKLAKQVFMAKLPPFKEVEIAAPSLELEVEVNSNNTDNIHWKKDGQRLKQSDNVEFVTDGTIRRLIIKKTICEEDAGVYTAKVGAKKTECHVSISLFGQNASNNTNANNNNDKDFDLNGETVTVVEPATMEKEFELEETNPNTNNNNAVKIEAAVDTAVELVNIEKSHERVVSNCDSCITAAAILEAEREPDTDKNNGQNTDNDKPDDMQKINNRAKDVKYQDLLDSA